jgi:hypothetical protein
MALQIFSSLFMVGATVNGGVKLSTRATIHRMVAVDEEVNTEI